jgi:hypothetical protein
VFENLDTVYKEEADAVFAAKSDVTAFFGTNEKRAKLLYKRLAAMFHPDVFTETRDKQDAEEVFKELGAIWDSYRVMHGFKAAPPPSGGLIIDGVLYTISDEAKNLSNETFKAFTILSAPSGASRVLFVSRVPDKNTGYANLLSRIEANGVCADLFVKPVSREFAIEQPDGRHSSFAADISDSGILRSLRYAESVGRLDAKDIAWIWRRTLSAAAVCADLSMGFGFAPDACYVDPERHGYMHMSFDIRSTDRSAANLASAAEFMVSVCDNMPDRMRGYFAAVPKMDVNPRIHPSELLADFDYILDRLWGSRKFHRFVYPENWT